MVEGEEVREREGLERRFREVSERDGHKSTLYVEECILTTEVV